MHGPSCRPRQNEPNRGMEEEEEVMEKEKEAEMEKEKEEMTNKMSANICLYFLLFQEEEDDTFHLLFWSEFEEHGEWCIQTSAAKKILSLVSSYN